MLCTPCCCCRHPAAAPAAPLPQDVIPEDKQPELLDSIQRGNVSMRVMRDVFESFLNMGPLSQVGREGWHVVWSAVMSCNATGCKGMQRDAKGCKGMQCTEP